MSPSRIQEPGSVAVVGMSGRFPGARDIASFWRNLRDGVEAARELSLSELEAAGVEPDLLRDPRYVRMGVVLEDVDRFDASFFGLTPREAELMDPQHRLFLECAWEAMEDAGYDSARAPGEVGVFASSLMSHYLLLHLAPRRKLMRRAGALAVRIFNDKDFLPTRVSYQLNLKGPSLAVQTACSSSLVGCHLACQSLINFECDMALAGGVALNLPQAGYLYQEGSIYSPDGHCRAFDTQAQGTINGSGVGIVVLRRLEDAIAAGDRIRAVIRGTAVNNDGSLKVGFTAPSVEGQAAVVASALEFSGVDPDTLGLIEAHGTGTPMGDPIEVAALTQVFRETTSRRGFCALGSVKASIGHLDAAAGVVGLIKAVLALEHKVIPPSVNCDHPHPEIDLPSTPFYIAAEAKPWVANGVPRRAGVTSLGVGGTNAHVVLEEPPPRPASGESRPWQLLVWSARDPQGLEDSTRRLAEHLESGPAEPLADLAYTLQMGRVAFSRRRALVCHCAEEALESLRGGPRRWLGRGDASGEPEVVFLFPGQGSQHPGMGRDLYRSEPVYRGVIDDCAERLQPHLGLDLRPLLHAAEDENAAARQLQQTRIAQPALFVVEYALARLWMDWGVTPRALLGHSVGEYVAACLAGVLSLADALELVVARGRLMQSLPPGAMLSVALSAGELEPLLDAQLSLAAINAETVTTVAGPVAAVEALAARLAERKVEHRRLRTSHAFHSAMVEPVIGAFIEQVAKRELRPPQIRLLSNVSGTWLTPQEATDPRYWGQQLRRTVRFSAALQELLSESKRALLEVGPGQALTRLARLHRQGGQVPWAVASMRHPQQGGADLEQLLGALGHLWAGGVRIDWERFARFERRHRVAAPTYPFQRQRYWIEPALAWGDEEEVPRQEMGQPASPLTDPRSGSIEGRLVQAAPTLPLEQAVARVWCEVLGVERIAAGDDFFELGGNSLNASQVVSRVWETLGIQASVQDLFEAPTVAGLAGRLSSVAAARLEASAGGTSSQATIVSPAPPLLPVAREGALPLSFAQQRLWFIDQLEPGRSLYNMPVALHVEGRLDAAVLVLTLGEIVRRHEALRTVFALREGIPVQVIQQPELFRLPQIDLSGLPASRREVQALALAGEEAGRPFDLARDPLLRGVLLRLADEDRLLALTMHHIASDGWSMGILVREVMALYPAFAAGRPSLLPELPVQYGDFAVWQHSWLHGDILENEIAFWRRQLAGLPPLLDLPTDRPRPAQQSFRGASRPVRLQAELIRQVETLSRREGATLFMTLLAGFQGLLARYSDQDDLAVGSPVAGRNRIETEGLIGLFVNTLVLRGNLRGVPTFRELLGRVRETALAAYLHQDVPFEKLVEELAPERSLAHAPLFQVMFVLQNAPFATLEIRDLRLRPAGVAATTAKFDLTLTLEEHDDGLDGMVEYAADLFDGTTIDRLIGHFERLLGAALAAPERAVAGLPLLSPAERHQLFAEWNDTAEARASRGCVHELFEHQARRTPEAVAVVFGSEELTYAELAARSGRLARRLRRLGVGPESRVGVALERSLDLVVALLGVLKAGAAYVPLDPDYPRERLAYVLEDAAPRVLITATPLLATFPPPSGAILCLDGEPTDDGLIDEKRGVPTPEDDRWLAYVLYTSGSTGRPKGVAVSHRALVNFLRSMCRAPGFAAGERLLAVTSLAFDIAALEIFLPLTTGGCVELASRAETADGVLLMSRLRTSGADVLQATPATWRMLLDAGWTGDPSLKALCGGEGLPRDLAVSLAGRTGELWNLYGPTETTVWSAAVRIPPGESGPVSIGRPIADTRIHLLDRELQTVPFGVPGELSISGTGVARGYLSQPDLTAERFVPDPFAAAAGEPGGRLYRTGDLARHLPSGRMEILGRIDHQIKVRGFRIEPGEIEAVLLTLPGVREAVVLAREDRSERGGGDRRLVAYVVGDVAADALRQGLRERLPEHMVPAAFVFLSVLPLTPNGKVDRKALPAPEWQSAAEGHLAPRTPVEDVLAGIWAEVLGLQGVGATDNFFNLGGHSLLATQVMSRLRGAFGVEVPLRDLFEAPVLADLATRVEMALRAGAGRLTPPLVPVPREGPLPLSFAQQRLWFIDQLKLGSPFYNMPVALRVGGPLDCALLALCFEEIVRRHEVLRTVFAAPEGEPVELIRPAAPFALPGIDLSGLQEGVREATALRLASEEAGRPFDLKRGPLLRGALLRLAEGDHIAVLTMHHIVSDGWSLGILVREVAALYPAFAVRQPSPLPELPVQYADFAAWQRSWLHGEALESEISFWRRELAGLPPLLELPTDRPRPAMLSSRGVTWPVLLPAGLTGQLEALARREGATLFMVLLAGFQTLLARYSGQEDLAVGSPASGRNRVETEKLIGFFVNTLVLRGKLAGEPTFRELLGRVRETALAAWQHQDVPFEKLVEELAPQRSLAYTPLFQVMFALQNAPIGDLEIEGLRLRAVNVDATTARFDLTVSLEEHEGGLRGTADFAADLFDDATIERLVAHLVTLLEGPAADAERPLSELPLLSPTEHAQLLASWTGPWLYPLWTEPVQDLFARAAERNPEAPALLFAGEIVSYGALRRRVSALATHLAALGVGPETRVVLAVDPSPEMISGLLGILEAGGAYVPLDPATPPERLAHILAETGAPVVLTQERHRAVFAPCGARVVCLDAPPPPEHGSTARPPGGTAVPESAAYVIHTSGSTGEPKGVMASHGGLASFTRAMAAALRLEPGDRVLQFASLSFDASAVQIFPPLASGATLVLHPNPRSLAPFEILDLCVQTGVTVLDLPAALWRQWVTTLPVEALARTAIRSYLTGGEAVPTAILREWAVRAAPGASFLSSYGPTEATVTTTAFQTTREGVEGLIGAEAPLGRPLPNTRLALLDFYGQTPPQGAPGEIYIGGVGLTRGYLHEPGLTSERFVPDPLSGEPGARLYRTGDLARLRPTGELEFLGRSDHQVKIRGYRIELGEIEAALTALPGVREAAVVVHEERFDQGPGDRRLVAYVVDDGAAGSDFGRALRLSLRERLPDYMVPAAFVMLPTLPLLPNGKLDRKALPAPQWQSAGDGYVAPRTPVEEVLAGIWTEVLGVEKIGASDNFFDLGGHSLLATQVMSRLRAAFGIEMPLRDLFAAPKLVDLAAQVEAVHRAGEAPPAPPLVPVPREWPLPLSFAQQRLWFVDQLEPDSPLYNISEALRVEGPLRAGVLALCLGEIAGRHEALRTVFAAPAGEPVQWIQPAAPFALPGVDLSGLPEGTREAAALRLAADETSRPFDLVGGPLLRGVLLRLAAEDYIVALTMHHIVSDGWSMGILVREITALYAAFAEGRPSPLPELPVQYADFAVWQASWLHGEILEKEISFWRRQLAGLPPLLDLPTDRPRPALQSFRGASRPVRLPAELIRQVEALSRREGATLFMVLLAGFQTLLARYSGQNNLAVGSPVAGRNRVETEGLIGFFVNTLILRGDLSGAPTFRELLGRVRETALAAYLHQDVPFEKLVEELAPERSLAHSPFFQVMLALQNAPAEELLVSGLSFSPVEAPGTTAKFDLTLSFSEMPEGLAGTLEYATDLFDCATAGRLLGHLVNLLASAAADPGVPLTELRLLGAAEEELLRRGLNQTEGTWAAPVAIHDLFTQQAGRTPDRTAAVGPEGALSYRDIAQRSAVLADRIHTVLASPLDRPIALLADPDPQVLIGMIAILHTGGGFVPLDPRHPEERLAWTLKDSACELLVTQRRHLKQAEGLGMRHILCLEDALPSPTEPACYEPRKEDLQGSLAYVVYTSGSTGRPKGVQISHDSLAPMLLWACDYFRLGEHTRVLQNLSFCFDFGIFEHLTTLLAGGTLVFPGEAARDPETFAREIVRHGINTLHTTPAFARELAAAGVSLDDLEVLHLGGEALARDTVARLRKAAPRSTIYNGYGPTEATVNSSIFRIGGSEDVDWPVIPIGQRSADNALYILDSTGRLVPFGARGELHVGGIGVARGYLNKPDLTAERFVPDPFGPTPGGRLYRTGDLVRYLPGGDIEFLGRMDHQVKLRGFRIELGEIEAALVTLPGVREAVVLAREDRSEGGAGDRSLIAYVVGEAAADALRQGLREQLPEHMVPAAYVLLAALPLNPNGKVDRKALPAPEWQSAGEGYVAPRTPIEDVLAGIWAQLLGIQQIGATDNFFHLGGHSLLATRARSRVRDALGVELPLRTLFERPMLAELAAEIETLRSADGALQRMAIERADHHGPLPLSWNQQRFWLLHQLNPDSAAFNLSGAVRLSGRLDGAALEASFGEIARRHSAVRTRIVIVAGMPHQIVDPPGSFTLFKVDLSGLGASVQEGELQRVAQSAVHRPFDLAGEPPLQVLLLHLTDDDHAVLFSLHHIAGDGWSLDILTRELGELYAARIEGRPSPLRELPIQYADWVVAQQEWLRGRGGAEQLAYWRRKLGGDLPVLTLPMQRHRPSVRRFRGSSQPLILGASLSAALADLSRRTGSTLFMCLLAAFKALLHLVTGAEDLLVGTNVANRKWPGTEGLIGLFVNDLALRTDLSGRPSFRELLVRVRETALEAYAHQDLPFEVLQADLRPERSAGPLFQVLFVLQNAPVQARELPGLTLASFPAERRTANFDLTLNLTEGANGLEGAFVYDIDLFEDSTIARLAEDFVALLREVVSGPDRPLPSLSFAPPAAAREMADAFNEDF